jgi:hypothetical protein
MSEAPERPTYPRAPVPAVGPRGAVPAGVAPRPPLPTRFAWATQQVPTWAGRSVLGVAVLAAVAVAGSPMGLGLAVALLAVGAIAARVRPPVRVPLADLRAAREPATGDRWNRVWWVLAAALALVPVLRAAAWVVVPAILTAATLASLAATGGWHWRALGAGLGVLWARLPQGLVMAPRAAFRGNAWRGAGPAARGFALAAVLLAVFVPLLASADAAFEQLLDDAFPTEWGVDQPVVRVLVLILFAAAGGGLLYVRLCPPRPAVRPPKVALGRLEWGLPLGALVALFAAFVALQLATLFGGDRHVLETAGLTYAEYARSGFAQLLAVAALTLAVVAAAGRWARDDGVLLRALLAALCVLTLVVLASALKRLGLYEDTYGFTRLRLAAHAALLFLGVVFCLILASRGAAAWLPRAMVAATAAAVLTFALADPERRIAEHNVERYERTGKIDMPYLTELGPDATPALAGFGCVRREPRPDGLAGLNLARIRARAAVSCQ